MFQTLWGGHLLCIYNSAAKFYSNFIYNDITAMGRISKNVEMKYRKETGSRVTQCHDTSVSLKVRKKELVVDFRKLSGVYTTACINGAEVEIVESFKFPDVNIIHNLA